MEKWPKKIQVCTPLLAGRELEYVTDAVSTGWISGRGPYVDKFEASFAKYVGTKHAVAVANGTVAMHLALVAAGIRAGDEVICPTFTMAGSVFPVCYIGAVPVLVDCTRDTWNIDEAQIEAAITSKTKAIMPVHIYGHPCAMDKIMEIARKHNLLVIEDAAEAIGSEFKGTKCGAFGDVSGFSLFANKVITSGEGGIITMNADKIFDESRYYKDLCFPLSGERTYTHDHIGFNYRMANTVAAIAFAQMEKADEYVEMRRRNAKLYNERLGSVTGITTPVERSGCKNTYWMYGVMIEDSFGMDREKVMKELTAYNIETRRFFTPMHVQPGLKPHLSKAQKACPVSEDVGKRGLYLPSSSGLTEKEIDYVCDVIRKIRG